MSNSTGYGQSFAMKLFHQGRYDEALAEADKAVARDADDPEPVLDRAHVLLAMERWEAGIADVERALVLDREARVLDDSLVDDLLFSSLVAWGKHLAATDGNAAARVLDRYGAILPSGAHADEAHDWQRRFRGELVTRSWTRQR